MEKKQSADIVLLSNAIYTGNNRPPFPGGIAVSKNKIIAVCEKKEIDEYICNNTKQYTFHDQLIMPGFCDAHGHYSMGALYDSKYFINKISHSYSEAECVSMVKKFAEDHPYYKNIIGQGWFLVNWNNGKLPTKKSLDEAIPDRPVFLAAADAHTGWLNSKALETIQISPNDPEYGTNIMLLPNGDLSGILREGAWFRLASRHTFMPDSSIDEEVDFQLMNKLTKSGITTFCDLSGILPGTNYDALERLDKTGKLTVRVNLNPALGSDKEQKQLLELKKRYCSDKLQVTGAKGVVDGVTSTHTGYLLEPYSDKKDTAGTLIHSKEYLEHNIIATNKHGIGVRLHCIADGSVRIALDCFEKSNKINGNSNVRNTIEHIEHIHPDDIPRFKELGVTASMQPRHLALDANEKIIRIGTERAKWAWPCKSILNTGAILALGTDYPVVDFNPFETVYHAVTRNGYDHKPTGVNPWEKISLTEALSAYTFGGAYASKREHELGTLERGKLADIIVLDRNIFDIDIEQIPYTKVLMTIFDGNIIYQA